MKKKYGIILGAVILVIIFLVGGILAYKHIEKEKKFNAYMKNAEVAIKNKEYDKAENLLLKAKGIENKGIIQEKINEIKVDKSQDKIYREAMDFENNGNYFKAIESFKSINPKAVTLAESGKEEIEKCKSKLIDSYVKSANEYISNGDEQDAKTAISNISRVDKNSPKIKELTDKINNMDQIALVEPQEFGTNNILVKNLGLYTKEKLRGNALAYIIGRNIMDVSSRVSDNWHYNKLYFSYGETVNYPSFLKPYFVPTDGKGMQMKSKDGKVSMWIAYFGNVMEDTVQSIVANWDKSNIISSSYGNDWFEICYRSNSEGKKNIYWCYEIVNPDVKQWVSYNFSEDLWENNKEQVKKIMDEARKSFNPATNPEW